MVVQYPWCRCQRSVNSTYGEFHGQTPQDVSNIGDHHGITLLTLQRYLWSRDGEASSDLGLVPANARKEKKIAL